MAIRTKTAARQTAKQIVTLSTAQEILRQHQADVLAAQIAPIVNRMEIDLRNYYEQGGT